MLTEKQIEKLSLLNKIITGLEQKIFYLAQQHKQEIEENLKTCTLDINDYEIEADICFCTGEEELISWNEYLKSALEIRITGEQLTGKITIRPLKVV